MIENKEKLVDKLTRDLDEVASYDEWSAREYGEYTLDCGYTAYKLVERGYQKVADNDIVISRSEYERLKLLSEINADLKQLGKSVEEALSVSSSDIEQVEKHTVKRCMQLLEDMRVPEDGRHDWRDYHNDTLDKCKARFTKEFGVKLNEKA